MLFVYYIFNVLQTLNALKLLEFDISISICIKKVVIPITYILLYFTTLQTDKVLCFRISEIVYDTKLYTMLNC